MDGANSDEPSNKQLKSWACRSLKWLQRCMKIMLARGERAHGVFQMHIVQVRRLCPVFCAVRRTAGLEHDSKLADPVCMTDDGTLAHAMQLSDAFDAMIRKNRLVCACFLPSHATNKSIKRVWSLHCANASSAVLSIRPRFLHLHRCNSHVKAYLQRFV